MDFLSSVGTYTWSTFAVVLLTAVVSYFTHRAKKQNDKQKRIDEARSEYRKALEEGDPEKIVIAKRKYHAAKALLVVLAMILTTSCISHREQFIPIGKYVSTPVAGDVVPELPEGEKRWLLISVPTGAELVLEKD